MEEIQPSWDLERMIAQENEGKGHILDHFALQQHNLALTLQSVRNFVLSPHLSGLIP